MKINKFFELRQSFTSMNRHSARSSSLRLKRSLIRSKQSSDYAITTNNTLENRTTPYGNTKFEDNQVVAFTYFMTYVGVISYEPPILSIRKIL